MSEKKMTRDRKHYLVNKVIRITLLCFLVAAMCLTAAGEEKAWIIGCLVGVFVTYSTLEINAGYAQLVDMTIDGTKPLSALDDPAITTEITPDTDTPSSSSQDG